MTKQKLKLSVETPPNVAQEPENPFLALSVELDSDIILINAPMAPSVDDEIRNTLATRVTKRANLIAIIVTPGGLADTAYRASVALQRSYDHVTVCVSGWCKSAGTLLAIGAHGLIVGQRGEMGPLDVQIAKRDDLGGDRDSGLILNEALERLRDESFGMFENFMIRLISQSQNNVTFRTAADIAAQMTIGLMSPVFDKIDPIRMGADARAMNIGRDYAIRLNMRSNNLRGNEALNMLLNGYPSHSFAIDLDEAQRLFINVKALDGKLAEAIDGLGDVAATPAADGQPVICYIDGVENEESAGNPNAGMPEANDSTPNQSDGGIAA